MPKKVISESVIDGMDALCERGREQVKGLLEAMGYHIKHNNHIRVGDIVQGTVSAKYFLVCEVSGNFINIWDLAAARLYKDRYINNYRVTHKSLYDFCSDPLLIDNIKGD